MLSERLGKVLGKREWHEGSGKGQKQRRLQDYGTGNSARPSKGQGAVREPEQAGEGTEGSRRPRGGRSETLRVEEMGHVRKRET